MTLNYELKFYDYWHLSSGLNGGSRLDSSVVKDEGGLPYAPGKTIKGLVREMAELLEDGDWIEECFGGEGVKMGACYFSNASLQASTKKQIADHALQDNLYDLVASTQIDENGIAVDKSLREIEVVIPISLYGEVQDIPKKHIEQMKKSFKMIKRAGLNRNRGLGRCELIVEVKS